MLEAQHCCRAPKTGATSGETRAVYTASPDKHVILRDVCEGWDTMTTIFFFAGVLQPMGGRSMDTGALLWLDQVLGWRSCLLAGQRCILQPLLTPILF